MQPILITGGAGFIGSCFVQQWLAKESAPVVVLDKLTYAGRLDNLAEILEDDRLTFVEGDIGNTALVDTLLNEHRPAAIVNFAAESHVDRSIDAPDVFVQTNIVGTNRLLESTLRYWLSLDPAAQGQFRFLHISTDEVYGSLGPEGKFTEESPYQPNSPYSASKAAADHLVRAYHHTYSLPTIITCCSNNFGPRQLPEKLVPLMIFNALEGKSLPLYGDGQHIRDWIYVEDHCQALRQVLKQGRVGEVYNIGGYCELRNKEIVAGICEIIDQQVGDLPHSPCHTLIEYVEDRPGHDRRYAIDITKIKSELGWQPSEDFIKNLRATVRWYLDHPQWMADRQRDFSLRKRIGLGRSQNSPSG